MRFSAPAWALKIEFVLASEASFNLPHDLALSPDSRYLYVADSGNDRVVVYEINGTRGERVAIIKGSFRRPEGVAA